VEGISRREFAKRCGCSEGTIRQAIKAGRLTPFADGSLDPELVVSFHDAGATETLSDAILRKERALARLRELEVDRELGRLCEVDMVLAAVASEYAGVRNKLLSIGSTMAPQLAICTDAGQCQALVDAAIHRALNQLSADDTFQRVRSRAAIDAKV